MLTYVKGDLIELAKQGEFEVVIHGCNCFCTMGAGVAAQIKQAFPAAYEVDLQTEKGSIHKLGLFSAACVPLGYPWQYESFWVVNLYTQFDYRGNGTRLDYRALIAGLIRVRQFFGDKNLTFGMPRIGAGLAGGNWNRIERIIEYTLGNEIVFVVDLND